MSQRSKHITSTYCVPWCFRPGCIDLLDFLNARRPMQFSPWLQTCTDGPRPGVPGDLLVIMVTHSRDTGLPINQPVGIMGWRIGALLIVQKR